MNIILLSGGSGKRLWPLSNEIRSKQFLKLFKNGDGYESMLQRMYRQIKEVDPSSNIIIATSKSQVSAIHNQLGENIDISVEPTRKDTFPAIVLASLYIKDVKKVDPNESVIICPVDPFVNIEYFQCLKEIFKNANNANISLMGIEPTYPSEKYGYIIPESKKHISKVMSFKEKPNANDAKKFIKHGALWNGGVFAFKLKYIIDTAHTLIDFKDYDDLFNKYASLNKISFDYAVVEKEKDINVIRFNGDWKDIGTWSTLVESVDDTTIGKGIQSNNVNTYIVNELDIPIVACGLKNIIISASQEGILVSDKNESSFIKPVVETIDQKIRFAEKSWGNYEVINVDANSVTIKVTLISGHFMTYHSHTFREETWVVIGGNGMVILDGKKTTISIGDIIRIKPNIKHTVIATTDLTLIEVQIGKEISVQDKTKYEMPNYKIISK